MRPVRHIHAVLPYFQHTAKVLRNHIDDELLAMVDTSSMAIGIDKLRQADLNLMVYFVVLVEEKSVSRAADCLGLTQPALSRALQRLRELFHDDLLVRTTKGYQTTPRGEELLGQLALVLPQLNSLIAGTGFDPTKNETTFNITAADSLAHLYGRVLAGKYADSQMLNFVFSNYSDDRYERLETNSQDLVLDADYVTLPSTLHCEPLSEEKLVCVVARESPHQGRITLKDYLVADHVAVNLLRGSQAIPDDALTRLGVRRRCVFTMPYFGVALKMVAGTSLVVTLSGTVANEMMDHATTRIVEAPEEIQPYRFVMVWHKRYDDDPRHAWLRQAFRDAAKQVRKIQRMQQR